MMGELDQTQINNLLSSQAIGRIACTDGNQPYIVPVTYTYDGQYIYGQTSEGKKLDIMRDNPCVCFEVDLMTDMRNWQSVLVYGDFEELDSTEALKAREILFSRVFPLITSATVYTYGHQSNGDTIVRSRRKDIMYRIKIKEVTGRFEKQ